MNTIDYYLQHTGIDAADADADILLDKKKNIDHNNNLSNHTASTVSMSPCWSVSEKALMAESAEEEQGATHPATISYGSIPPRPPQEEDDHDSDSCCLAAPASASTTREEKLAAFISETVSPPLKMRKTQSLMTVRNQRWISESPSPSFQSKHYITTNQIWPGRGAPGCSSSSSPVPPMRKQTNQQLEQQEEEEYSREGDEEDLDEIKLLNRSNDASMARRSIQDMRRCVSSNDARLMITMSVLRGAASANASFFNDNDHAEKNMNDKSTGPKNHLLLPTANSKSKPKKNEEQEHSDASGDEKHSSEKDAQHKRLEELYGEALAILDGDDDDMFATNSSSGTRRKGIPSSPSADSIAKTTTTTSTTTTLNSQNQTTTGPPKVPRRQTCSNLQAIGEESSRGGRGGKNNIDTSIRMDESDHWTGAELDLSFRGSKTSFVSVLSTDSTVESEMTKSNRSNSSSQSMGLASVFRQPSPSSAGAKKRAIGNSNTKNNLGNSMASVFSNSALTAEQQAKLEELRRITALQNGSSSLQRGVARHGVVGVVGAGPAMGTFFGQQQKTTLSAPYYHGFTPAPAAGQQRNTFAGGLMIPGGGGAASSSSPSRAGISMPAPQRKSSLTSQSSSQQQEEILSPRRRSRNSLGSRGKLDGAPPLSPQKALQRRSLDGVKDLLPSAVAHPSTTTASKKRMPFGYKTKSTNGLFGTVSTGGSKTPSPRSSNDSLHSRSGVERTIKEGTMRRSHSWLDEAPVKGEQLAAMKALLLGLDVASASPSTTQKKQLISRSQFGSTPALAPLGRQRSLRQSSDGFKGKSLSPHRKTDISQSLHVSTSTSVLKTTASSNRCQSSSVTPVPSNQRWEANNNKQQGTQLSAPRLSGRRSTCNTALQTSGSPAEAMLAGLPVVTTPEAIAMNALMMRGQAKQGGGTRLGKAQASLGQLKRSRLSLANLKPESPEEAEASKSGGMNSTWETNEHNVVSSPLLKAHTHTIDSTGRDGGSSNNSNIFASIILPSVDKSPGRQARIRQLSKNSSSRSSSRIDLDSKLATRKKHDQHRGVVQQSGSMIDLTALPLRNKSDLKHIVFSSGGQLASIKKGNSSVTNMQTMDRLRR